MVLAAADVDRFIAEAAKGKPGRLRCGRGHGSPRLCMTWRGDHIVNIARSFLDTNGVTQEADVRIEAPEADAYYRNQVPDVLRDKPLAQAFRENLARLEVCGQRGLGERFDAPPSARQRCSCPMPANTS